MATIIRVKSSKMDKLSENIEKSLKYLGKAMQCVESMGDEDDDEYNERNYDEGEDYDMNERYNMRRGSRRGGASGRGGNRYGGY